MKRVLLTLAVAGALALPTGVALAQDDPPEGSVACEPQRDRDRDRARDQVTAEDEGVTVDVPQRGDEERPLRLRLHDGSCDAECDGEHNRAQERNPGVGDRAGGGHERHGPGRWGTD